MDSKTIASLLCTFVLASACSINSTPESKTASCQLPSDLSTLTGSYSSENIGINSNGKHLGDSKLSITVDADGVFSGERSWSSERHSGHSKNGAITKGDTEKIIGVINPKNCQIGIAEFGESGHYNGQLLFDGSIDLILVQSGDKPVVMRNRYQKN